MVELYHKFAKDVLSLTDHSITKMARDKSPNLDLTGAQHPPYFVYQLKLPHAPYTWKGAPNVKNTNITTDRRRDPTNELGDDNNDTTHEQEQEREREGGKRRTPKSRRERY